MSSGAQNAIFKEAALPDIISESGIMGKSLAFISAEETMTKNGKAFIEAKPADGDRTSEFELEN